MLGPLISSSPIVALRHVAGPRRRRCGSAVCIIALPAEPTLRMASAASSMVPAGLVSVMPQPWTSGTPRALQPSRMASAQGAPPTPEILQAREVGALELRMLHHELVGRRHAEEVGDAERGIGEVVERQAGLEGAHDQDRAAGMQHGIGVAVEAAGMEQRQDHELHGLRRDQRRDAEVDGVPEHHAVGDDRALRMPGGARGVHHHADVVVRQRHAAAARRRADASARS